MKSTSEGSSTVSIGDTRRHDESDLTVEHIGRVAKAKKKSAVQMTKIVDACAGLKRVAENRSTYCATPEMWERILGDARREIDDLEMTINRAAERQARGRRRWEW